MAAGKTVTGNKKAAAVRKTISTKTVAASKSTKGKATG